MHIVLKHVCYSFNDENKLFKYILSKNIILNLNKTKKKKKSKNRAEDLKRKYFRLKLFINDKKKKIS